MLGKTLIKRTIPDFNEKFSVKERIFLYYMFFFALLSAFTILSNTLYGLDFSFDYKWIMITLFSTILTVMALKRYKVNLIHRIGTYCIALVILPVSGLTSSGLISSGILYSLLILILINYLLRGWERIFLNIANILINMALITLFRFHPEIFKTMTSHEQFMGWIINVPIIFTFITIQLITFEKAYETERVMNEETSKKLKQLSQTDFLTGLFNRAHLEEKLSFLNNVYARTETPYSIIMIDIDYFKAYNDLHGHLEGDKCLKNFGALLRDRITRNTDWAYRYGGEEFLILLGFAEEKGAEFVARLIQKDLEEVAIPHGGSVVNKNVTISIGIATIRKNLQSHETIIKYADKALYNSKKNGRNRISHYEENMEGSWKELI